MEGLHLVEKFHHAVLLNLPNAVTLLQFLMVCWPPQPNHKIISLLLHNRNFATVMNPNVDVWCAAYLMCGLCKRVFWPAKGIVTHRLRTTSEQTGRSARLTLCKSLSHWGQKAAATSELPLLHRLSSPVWKLRHAPVQGKGWGGEAGLLHKTARLYARTEYFF